jgi:mRNA interferase RelE/StbE
VTYRVDLVPSAQRELVDIPLRDRKRIDERILALASNPRPSGVKALQGQKGTYYRLRVGDYRIVYQVQDKALIVLVVKIGHRREVYRGL